MRSIETAPTASGGRRSTDSPQVIAFQSFASDRFWQLYRELPEEVQRLADKQYELFRWTEPQN
jgi:hypothetical protein